MLLKGFSLHISLERDPITTVQEGLTPVSLQMQYDPLSSATIQQRAKGLLWSNLIPFLLLLGVIVGGEQNKEP